MNGPDRYRTLSGRAPDSTDDVDFGSLEGLDPVTGLPVLIYDFEGQPLAAPGDLDSENIPRILWAGVDEGRGRVVVALSPGWQRLSEESQPLTLGQLLAAAGALRTAAAADVAHGDLAPWRLLLVGDRLQVEGYGVPWRPSAGRYRAPEVKDSGTLAGDVYSLAALAGEVGVAPEDETVAAVLEQCLADDPLERPSAEELLLALEALGAQAADSQETTGSRREGATSGSRREGAASGSRRVDETSSESTDHRSGDPIEASAPPGEESSTAPKGVTKSEPGETEPPGQTPATRPSAGPTRSAPPGPAKKVPAEPAERPLARPAAAPPEQPAETRRRLTLLGALMAAVVILALLALYGPRGSDPPAPTPLQDTVYVVEVEVVPGDLPPVTIHLISSPEGSSLGRGESIGTAPRHLALDREGTWAFQGSLQGRRSEVVEIEVPEQRTVTLVMPR